MLVCSHHDRAEILLKLALNTNQSINQSMLNTIQLFFISGLWKVQQKNMK